jgi:MerR family transcriptional regulator, mercuric resistance operon regulatory protein
MEPAVLTIGGLSQRTGCNIETIRYYERVRLLPHAQRRGRYRTYSNADVARLHFVMRSRELGFSLDDIRALLMLSSNPDSRSCGQAQNLAAGHLAAVRARLRDLRRMERVLSETIRKCKNRTTPHCPLIEALSGKRK